MYCAVRAPVDSKQTSTKVVTPCRRVRWSQYLLNFSFKMAFTDFQDGSARHIFSSQSCIETYNSPFRGRPFA
jgi:hypothetical protein